MCAECSLFMFIHQINLYIKKGTIKYLRILYVKNK